MAVTWLGNGRNPHKHWGLCIVYHVPKTMQETPEVRYSSVTVRYWYLCFQSVTGAHGTCNPERRFCARSAGDLLRSFRGAARDSWNRTDRLRGDPFS